MGKEGMGHFVKGIQINKEGWQRREAEVEAWETVSFAIMREVGKSVGIREAQGPDQGVHEACAAATPSSLMLREERRRLAAAGNRG